MRMEPLQASQAMKCQLIYLMLVAPLNPCPYVLGNRCPKTALIHRKTHQIAHGTY